MNCLYEQWQRLLHFVRNGQFIRHFTTALFFLLLHDYQESPGTCPHDIEARLRSGALTHETKQLNANCVPAIAVHRYTERSLRTGCRKCSSELVSGGAGTCKLFLAAGMQPEKFLHCICSDRGCVSKQGTRRYFIT